MGLYAQAVDVDTALRETANKLEKQIPQGWVTAILNIESESKTLSDYVIDELSTIIINNNNLIIVDRQNLDTIQQELNFQMSGEVSDESAQSIGQKLGAQTIISGSLRPVGDYYQLTLRALAVETAVVQGIQRQNIILNKRLSSLIKGNNVIPLSDMWKYKWLYLGSNLGGNLNIYDLKTLPYSTFQSDNFKEPATSVQFTGGISLGLQISSWLGIETGVQYTRDETEVKPASSPGSLDAIDLYNGSRISLYDPDSRVTLSFNSLMFPVVLQFSYRPGHFSFAGLTGAYLSVPISQMKFSGSLQHANWEGTFEPKGIAVGFIIGGNVGYNLGAGILFIDVRYAMDLTKIKFEPVDGLWGYSGMSGGWAYMPSFEFARKNVSFTLGYKIGIFNKQ